MESEHLQIIAKGSVRHCVVSLIGRLCSEEVRLGKISFTITKYVNGIFHIFLYDMQADFIITSALLIQTYDHVLKGFV